jgi:predicted ATP-grasp superfamily ATP-dependent carboligase
VRHRPPVLALGAGITLLGTLRSLGRSGIRAYVASPVAGFVRRSRYVHPLPRPIRESADPVALAAALSALPFERAVLMPCTDLWAAAVAGLEGEAARRFPTSISDARVQDLLADKGRFAEALRRFDVPHPRTVAVGSAAELAAIPDRELGSSFLKPRTSQQFSTRYGVKAFRCADKETAIERYEEARRDGFDLLLQEYVPGPSACHYFVDGFVDRNGATLARFARRRLRMDPPDFGNSTCLLSVPLEDVAPAIASLDRLLGGLGFRGIFSAEFKRDPRDGVFKLLEVNARPWWYVGFAAACGVDVCRLAYLDALGLPAEPIRSYRTGVRCVFLQHDWAACRRLRREGRMGWAECARDWLRSEKPVLAWDDPLPALWNTVTVGLQHLRRRPEPAPRPASHVEEPARAGR